MPNLSHTRWLNLSKEKPRITAQKAPYRYEIMNKKFKSQKTTTVSYHDGLLKADINIVESDQLVKKLFGNQNIPLESQSPAKYLINKRGSVEYGNNDGKTFYSKRLSASTLYNETESFKNKIRSVADSNSVYKSDKSVKSDKKSNSSNYYISNFFLTVARSKEPKIINRFMPNMKNRPLYLTNLGSISSQKYYEIDFSQIKSKGKILFLIKTFRSSHSDQSEILYSFEF